MASGPKPAEKKALPTVKLMARVRQTRLKAGAAKAGNSKAHSLHELKVQPQGSYWHTLLSSGNESWGSTSHVRLDLEPSTQGCCVHTANAGKGLEGTAEGRRDVTFISKQITTRDS